MRTLTNVSLTSPNLKKSQIRDFAKARKIMNRVETTANLIRNSKEGSVSDLDDSTDSVTLFRAHVPNYVPDYTGFVKFGSAANGDSKLESVRLLADSTPRGVEKETYFGFTSDGNTDTYQITESNNITGTTSDMVVSHNRKTDTISFQEK